MAEEKIVTMSEKGKVTIPVSIRKNIGLKGKSKFIITGTDDYIILKHIKIPSLKERFESLAEEIEEKFKREGIKRKDINDAIKWARKK